jgi:hypothetical protein
VKYSGSSDSFPLHVRQIKNMVDFGKLEPLLSGSFNRFNFVSVFDDLLKQNNGCTVKRTEDGKSMLTWIRKCDMLRFPLVPATVSGNL